LNRQSTREMKKKLRTAGERIVSKEIKVALDSWESELFEKVRIADVVDIQQLSQRGLGTYALQAHFDFVVVDKDEIPQFAIEYDGAGHKRHNDEKKDQICIEANLALFRIFSVNALSTISKMSIVKYLIDLWYFALEFKMRQEEGHISPDEPFSMSAFLRPGAKHIFDSEYNFFGLALAKIRPLATALGCKNPQTIQFSMQSVRLRGPDDEIVAYESVLIGDRQIVGKYQLALKVPSYGALAEIMFTPWEIAEFASGLALEDMIENMRLVASGGAHVVPSVDDYINEIRTLQERGYRFAGGGSASSSGRPLISGRLF
jgi:hypothetical protein